MNRVPLHLRSDAEIQFNDLIKRSEVFREYVGSLHHLATCKAARTRSGYRYSPHSEVHTETLTTGDGVTLSVDFRIEKGPAVVIEDYFLQAE